MILEQHTENMFLKQGITSLIGNWQLSNIEPVLFLNPSRFPTHPQEPNREHIAKEAFLFLYGLVGSTCSQPTKKQWLGFVGLGLQEDHQLFFSCNSIASTSPNSWWSESTGDVDHSPIVD